MTLEVINSSENANYKKLKKLAGAARDRRKTGQTVLDGTHLLFSLAESQYQPECIVVREDSLENDEIQECLDLFSDTKVLTFSKKLFNTLSPVETPVGILAIIEIPATETKHYTSGLLLEDIQDPGNLGSIIRTAAGAGIEAVYLSKACAEAWSPKALRAGMGAQFNVAIHENKDLTSVAKGFDKVIATELGATQSIYEVDLSGAVAFIFGNEGGGLSSPLLERATNRVNIPMPGEIESLNVAASVAVCLFERVRQINLLI